MLHLAYLLCFVKQYSGSLSGRGPQLESYVETGVPERFNVSGTLVSK